MKYFTKLFVVILLAGSIAGCEKQEYMKSESEIKKELSHPWEQILMIKHNASTQCMLWKFKDDNSLTIYLTSDSLITNNLPATDTLTGTYSVNTTVSKVFIDTGGFPDDPAWYWLNAEWNVVGLDDKGLVIASEDPKAGGINEREFKRID